jgi:hypothetical protein
MGIVYFIQCLETNEIYIGSTTQTLKDRMKCHRHRAKFCSSSRIIERGNYIYDVLEEVDDNDKLREREQYYLDTTECINITNSFSSPESKKKQNNIRSLRFREKNPDYRKIKTTCECGAIVRKENMARHKRTDKHINLLSSCVHHTKEPAF